MINSIKMWTAAGLFPEKFAGTALSPFMDFAALWQSKYKQEGEVYWFEFPCSIDFLTKYDALKYNRLIPLVSRLFVDTLYSLGVDRFQPVPVSIRCLDGLVLNYFLINILEVCDVIDLDKSAYESKDNWIHFFKSVAFRGNLREGLVLARDVHWMEGIFVSEEFASAVSRVFGRQVVFCNSEIYFS